MAFLFFECTDLRSVGWVSYFLAGANGIVCAYGVYGSEALRAIPSIGSVQYAFLRGPVLRYVVVSF